MTIDRKYDVLVIGTGPGGEGAAMQAVKAGQSVAVAERDSQIGGSCTHRGTIPSKALRYAVSQYVECKTDAYKRTGHDELHASFPALLKRADSVIDRQVTMRHSFYDRNGVDVLFGHARFVDSHRVEISERDGGRVVVAADSFIIATGSRPYRPDNIDFTHPRIFDSDTILNLGFTPRSITIYGAGVVGSEYASIFRNLGVKVNLVNTREKLLAFLDDEIIDALSYHLRDRGVLIRHREAFESVEGHSDGVILNLQSGKRLKTDILLWAAGRSGNTAELGVDTLGITPNSRGQLDVNENLQTEQPHIYAVGDVIGPPALASAAYVQGRYAAKHLMDGVETDRSLLRAIPSGIYTSPEISSLGKTERELTTAEIPYEVGHSMFKSLARAQITGATVGMLKILFHRDTREILGIHCFGRGAAEIIHIGQAIMAQEGSANTLDYFVNTTFNYPTMAEAYRVAALNGLNRLFE